VESWERYGRAVIGSMQEVLRDAADDHHPLLLETADYWLTLGLSLGTRRPEDAERLLALIAEREGEDPAELDRDADEFCAQALG
jgi:hypothetical protein